MFDKYLHWRDEDSGRGVHLTDNVLFLKDIFEIQIGG